MANRQRAIYLNDHLAGAVTALEILAFLRESFEGTEAELVAAELQALVTEDRAQLESLMAHLDIPPSPVRKAAAWVGEKLSELKLRSGSAVDLHRLEACEVLSLGVEGKALLWRGLAMAAQTNSALRVADYQLLIQRAEAQRRQVEEIRLIAARATLVPD